MATKFGKPAIASWAPDRIDVFIRTENHTLLHSWSHGDQGATVDLGGKLASDPVAAAYGEHRLSVFARGADLSLMQWLWDPLQSRMLSPENWGWLATDPVAIGWRSGGLVDALARSVDGPLLHWWTIPGSRVGPIVSGSPSFAHNPVPISRAENKLDVFVRSTDNNQLEQWQWDGSALTFREVLGGHLISDPVAVSWADDRIDIYARSDGGKVRHWGWDGRLTHRWFKNEDSIAEPLVADPTVASREENQLDMFARAAGGTLLHWRWNPTARTWLGPTARTSGLGSDPVALSRAPGTVDVFARVADGRLLHGTWNGTEWNERFWNLELTAPPETPWLAGETTEPRLLLVRPKDHLVVGLHWAGCELRDQVPPVLQPTAGDARVILTLPPQHLAEEVAPAEGPLVPTVDPNTTGGFPTWQARLARASRLAIAVDAGTSLTLTAKGLLEALKGARVLPGSRNPDDNLTAIDLPYGLIISPENGGSAGSVRAEHASQPIELGSGAVGLWRTRLTGSDPLTRLVVRVLHASRADPFPLALNRDSRLVIFQQATPADAARLELSALGGSLSATGRWPTFEWDHHATLGRDQTVRTAAKGVLYPLGHRAEYIEITERLIDPLAGGGIAVLRKQRILIVTEPVRGEDATLSRAFPFSDAEITTDVYTSVRDPTSRPDAPPEPWQWRWHERETLEIAFIEQRLDQLRAERQELHDSLHGDMGWGGGPVSEQLANDRQVAVEYLRCLDTIRELHDEIEALRELGLASDPVPVFFWPSRADGVPIRFPVRLGAANGSVHVDLPLIFVQDHRLRGDLRKPFDSLTDPTVAAALDQEYAARGAGIVELAGTPLDLVRSQRRPRLSGDVQEVLRINIVGVPREGRFRPRLGRPEIRERSAAEAWGFEVALPALRSLLGAAPEAARARMAFARDYEINGEAEDCAYQVAGDALDVNFAGASNRSGGLVSPRLAADAVSRTHGLVNLEGTRSLDPAKLLSDGASLLGFDLRALVGQITTPPAMTTALVPGRPPEVKMVWESVPLRAFPEPPAPGVFKPGTDSKLTMTVVSSPTVNQITCHVGSFSLVMPPGADALLELSFESLTFTQTGHRPPTLDVKGIDAKFVGKLKLLQVLQESVGLASAGPKIELSPAGITARYLLPVPDVGLLAFTMSNLVFSAGVSVPFTKDPVAVCLGFGSREKPFTLTVLAFGGGGYVDFEIVHTGLRRFEVSLEFGAAVAISIGIASVEIHAFGGIRFALQRDGAVKLTGYIRIGGSVDLLGLVSVSIELRVELDYRVDTNRMVGRAKLVLEIDLTLYSDSIEVDSGEWVIAGGDARRRALRGDPLSRRRASVDAWAAYLEKFKP